jgi:hypothetical protein
VSDRLFVSTRKGLFRIDRADGAWRIGPVSFLGDSVSLTLPDRRDGAVYAALNLGHFGVKLHRSRDGGETWQELPAPAFPEQPEGAVDTFEDGRPYPGRVEQIWALEPGLPNEPNVLWAGTVGGGLFKSVDSGASWQLIESLWYRPERKHWGGAGNDVPAIHSIVVDPRDAKHVTIAISTGGVWETLDGGETWANRSEGMYAEYMPPELRNEPNAQDVHRIVACAASPDHLWAQHHNGFFRSTDSAAHWNDLSDAPPAKFGFAVAAHPRDPNTAWRIPAIKDERRIPVAARVVVTRTRDGGASWDVLTKGLPQRDAYDLVYRHALDIDETGDRLAFGSTTGALWVSENGGDSWTELSSHLPPIYAVRFG